MFELNRLKKYLSNELNNFPLIKRILRDIYIASFADSTAEKAIYSRLNGKLNAYFIQIGSNDGKTNDPLFRIINENKSWHGLLVEPSPDAFKKLLMNYNYEERFVFENIGISDIDGSSEFYMIRESDAKNVDALKEFWHRVNSFSKEHVLRHVGSEHAHLISCIKIETMCFATLLKKHKVNHIDILHIDAEGYDYIILKQIDLSVLRPNYILFEHKHMNQYDRLKCYMCLAQNKYFIKVIGYDTLATLDKKIEDKILMKAAKLACKL